MDCDAAGGGMPRAAEKTAEGAKMAGEGLMAALTEARAVERSHGQGASPAIQKVKRPYLMAAARHTGVFMVSDGPLRYNAQSTPLLMNRSVATVEGEGPGGNCLLPPKRQANKHCDACLNRDLVVPRGNLPRQCVQINTQFLHLAKIPRRAPRKCLLEGVSHAECCRTHVRKEDGSARLVRCAAEDLDHIALSIGGANGGGGGAAPLLGEGSRTGRAPRQGGGPSSAEACSKDSGRGTGLWPRF
eukprot:gene14982-biopygen12621